MLSSISSSVALFQPFVSHFSLTFPLIKISVHQDLTTRIVFDKVVVKGKQAPITESFSAEALSVSSRAVI